MSPRSEPSLLTTQEAAARLGCDISTVRRLIRNLELRATRYGLRTYLIAPRDLARVKLRKVGRPKKETEG